MLPRNSITLLFGVVVLVTIALVQTQPDDGEGPPDSWPPPRWPPTRWPPYFPTRRPREAIPTTPRPCPKQPQKCSTAGPQLCVRSRNGRLCRRLANKCALRQLNCQSQPRNNWVIIQAGRCSQLKVGGPAAKCSK